MGKFPAMVEVLQKVILSLIVKKNEDDEGLPVTVPLEFIVSLGSKGLTPFEQDLMGKVVGDTFMIRLSRERLAPYFQHLMLPRLPLPASQEIFYLQVHVDAVGPASQREIIKGMAMMAGCGHHGDDGDCGCGSH
ncbi:MAG: hypothetical protein JXO49_12555 [Deltaproteobacteria bacterium]|nr:hypothetical protein [Candidatus Anaeroferrophillus wilburensis]MBN2890159.1 hypothetical protein [Deltaproteobacteria bacterium]